MKRKNKIIAALAIGAVVLLVASGVARCSMQGGGEGKTEEKQLQVAGQQSSAQTNAASFSAYENTDWRSADGQYALSILPGVIVEKGPGHDVLFYYQAENVKSDGKSLSADIKLATEKGGKATTSAISIVEGNGSATLACDALKADYTMETGAADIQLSSFEADHPEFKGIPADAFREAVAKAAARKSPYAKTATWTKEVWIDYATGTTVTNFRLDDGASTAVTVQIDLAGKLAAS